MIINAVFLGSKKFGLNLFKAIYSANQSINWTILCPPDLNDLRTYFAEFQEFAKLENIDLLTVNSSEMVMQYAKHHSPDVIIVCGYYRILPSELLTSVQMGVWGIHNSLLPKYRGGAPLVWQLINDEEVVGSSFFKITSGMDDGAILDQVKISNSFRLTISEASDQIEQEWIKKIPSLWNDFCNGNIQLYEQEHKDATYSAARQEIDGLIDWTLSVLEIDAFIRAQDHPYPRAFFNQDKKIVKVVEHKIDPRKIYGTPGQIFQITEKYVTVCCAEHTALQIYKVQVGGKIIDAKSVINSIKIRLA